MDCSKVGKVIQGLRKELHLTQSQVAERMNLSEKTVSKWERGLGCPDVACLNELAKILKTTVECILGGNLGQSGPNSGNLKNLKFYICPICGNLVTAFNDMSVHCCGRKMECKTPKKAEDRDKLRVENMENELYVSGERAMTKADHVIFVAYLVSDKLMLARLYPEWNLQTRFFCYGHGKLVWGTNTGELFEQQV